MKKIIAILFSLIVCTTMISSEEIYQRETIRNDEIDKLTINYRGYASKNEYEYIACAWRYMELIGEEKYSEDYPLTYQLFLQGLNRLK